MATENISIQVQDQVDGSISTKLRGIATDATAANAAVNNLKAALANINAGAVTAMTAAMNSNSAAVAAAALSQQRLQTAIQQTATAAQRLQTTQQQTATATSNAAAASDRAALAALRLQVAQDKASQSHKSAADSLLGYVKAAAALAGLSFSIHGIAEAADEYTMLENKLRSVNVAAEDLSFVMNKIGAAAIETRTDLESTAVTFQRMSVATHDLGMSQKDVLDITTTLTKSIQMSGASAQAAKAGLYQLAEGMEANRLQGIHLKALITDLPMLAQQLAKAMGTNIDGLRKMGTDGALTASVLVGAIQKIKGVVDEGFGKSVETIAQSFTNLNTKFIMFIGQLNEATGASKLFTSAIDAIGNNLPAITLAIAVLGTTLLVAFAPAIAASILACAEAIGVFSLALLANPIGLFVIAVTAAIGAVLLFRQEIEDSSPANASLIADLLELTSILRDGIVGALNMASQFMASFNGTQADATTGATALNIALTIAVGAFKIIMLVAADTAYVFQAVGREIGAIAAQLVALAHGDIKGFHAISDAVRADAVQARKEIDALELRIMNMGKGNVNNFGGLDKLSSGIDKLSSAATFQFKPPKNPHASDDGSDGKAAEDRAKALAKVNGELDNQISRMNMLKPLRDDQAKFDSINLSLQQKKITLTTAESDSIKARITAIREGLVIQTQMDRIYNDSIMPLQNYNAALEAANRLRDMGAISQADYIRETTKSREAYLNLEDPMRQYNRDLQQQFDLLAMIPKAREVEQQIMQVTNEQLAKGNKLTTDETQALREKLTLLQQLNGASQQEASILAETVGKREQSLNQMKAIQNLQTNKDSGFTKGDADTATSKIIGGLGLDTSNLQVQAGAQVAVYQNMYQQIDELRKKNLISETDASQLSFQVWQKEQTDKLSAGKEFFTGLAALSSSKNKSLAAIGKAAAITNAIVNTYTSATGAYAAMSSIPYVGPALGAAAAAAAIAAGMANVAAIRSQNSTGYQTGGYTGSMGVSEVAGVVHGQEYVLDAATTSRIGVANLNDLKTGAANVQKGDSSSVGSTTSGTAPAPGSTPQASGNGVRIINVMDPSLVSDYMNSPSGEKTMINFMSRNATQVKQILG